MVQGPEEIWAFYRRRIIHGDHIFGTISKDARNLQKMYREFVEKSDEKTRKYNQQRNRGAIWRSEVYSSSESESDIYDENAKR